MVERGDMRCGGMAGLLRAGECNLCASMRSWAGQSAANVYIAARGTVLCTGMIGTRHQERYAKTTPAPPRRSIEECIALLPADSPATIDEDFAGCGHRVESHE
jgi:hypothetical protein